MGLLASWKRKLSERERERERERENEYSQIYPP
jgi:hypothetical protein